MAISQDKKDRISEIIKNILIKRIDNFPELDHQNRNAPFHDLILSAFKDQLKKINVPTPYLIAVSSWLHGLSTSLGTGFENLSHILSGGYKREFTNHFVLKVTNNQARNIELIIRELKGGKKPNLKQENEIIFQHKSLENKINSLGFVVDNYLEKNNFIEGIELKSVRPNSGEVRGEKQKILEGKIALRTIFPKKKTQFFIGFPFDPTSNTPVGFDKKRCMS